MLQHSISTTVAPPVALPSLLLQTHAKLTQTLRQLLQQLMAQPLRQLQALLTPQTMLHSLPRRGKQRGKRGLSQVVPLERTRTYSACLPLQ